MPEHVTIFAVRRGDPGRVVAVFDRVGQDGEVRGHERRDAEAVFSWLVAAKGRYPITRVTRHVCRHDEGQGFCIADEVG